MSEQHAADAPPRRRLSVFRLILWLLGGLIVLGVGLFGLDQVRSSLQIQSAVTHLDETDPGWRLEHIEAARASLPDHRNSAMLCKELVGLLGPKWHDDKLYEAMKRITLRERLDEGRMKLLEAEMARLEPIRRLARPLADMPQGRFEIEYGFNPLDTLLPHVQQVREVGALLRYEMLYLSNQGDVTGAVRSGRACVCAGRALYDEPVMVSQLARIAIVSIGLQGVERALSLGESNEAELVALDTLLDDEEKHPTALLAMCAERAASYQLFSRMGSGTITADGLSGEKRKGAGPVADQSSVFSRWQVRRQQPLMMDLMNRLVENARLPPNEQLAAEKQIELESKEKRLFNALGVLFVPAALKVAEACRRKTSLVAAMRCLIALKRYRMKHGKWPATLADAVPEFLKAVPADPFDGKPIHLARVPDGVIVYSVGNDGVDDGGKLDRERPTIPGVDVGFQLWDKDERGRPASPPKREEKQP